MSEPLRNPFRNEGDAFRILMMVVAAGALVVAVALITRPLIGALLGLVLVAAGLWRAWGWGKEWFAARTPADADAERAEPDRD